MSAPFGLSKDAPRRTVAMAKHVRVLQKFIFLHHLLELGTGYKEIFPPILLRPARRPSSVRNRKVQSWNDLPNFIHERGFARTRRRRDNVDGGHSRFCTCSRAFSISAFMDSPSSVIFIVSPDNPEVFDSNVFASRFISCSRKSNFFPTSPP